MSVEHTYPDDDVRSQTPIEVAISRSDVSSWRTPFGLYGAREWAEDVVHTLKVSLPSFGSASAASAMNALAWFERHAAGPGYPFWLPERISRHHAGVDCGPDLTDGTQTVFIVPVAQGGTVNAVFVDGVYQEESAYTVYNTANRATTNALANGEGYTTGRVLVGECTEVSEELNIVRMGHSSLKHVIVSMSAQSGSYDVYQPVEERVVYSCGASFYLTGGDAEVKLILQFYSGAGVLKGTTTVTETIASGEWVDLYSAGNTSPADAYSARLSVLKSTVSDNPFYVGGIFFVEGHCSTRPKPFLPSYAPMVVVFDSAPASGKRVSADVTGERMWRVMRDDDYLKVAIVDDGSVIPAGFKATEVL